LQHSDVIEAKENQDEDLVKIINEKIADITEEISQKRAEGMGWGYIAKLYKVHPKYLGLGHRPHVSTQLPMKSEIKAATARRYKGNSMKGYGMSDSVSNGKNSTLNQKKRVGQAYSDGHKNRGLASGHSKDQAGGRGQGKSNGKNK
jgi:hypothetical protein